MGGGVAHAHLQRAQRRGDLTERICDRRQAAGPCRAGWYPKAQLEAEARSNKLLLEKCQPQAKLDAATRQSGARGLLQQQVLGQVEVLKQLVQQVSDVA